MSDYSKTSHPADDGWPKAFHPILRDWFADRFDQPTDIQARCWPLIASGNHVFAVAPTGSGKTLTAFLWALNQLLAGAWPTGVTSLLYISPLKALNNDIARNLTEPLAALRARFAAAGLDCPEIKVAVRSGDTSDSQRRAMLRRPPEILVCTPESLGIMLTSRGGSGLLGNLRAVILDEIHAVAGNKRGTALMANVERLVDLSGELQRIALSATVNPAQAVAAFAAGYLYHSGSLPDRADDAAYRPRYIHIVRSAIVKRLELAIAPLEQPLWERLTEALYRQVTTHRSTLIFVPSRRLAERLTRCLNDRHGGDLPLVYSHHGSLSREIRLEVESRLKAGGLRGIVATSSLELGIDIGELDLVLLVGLPDSVSSALQRLGRCGHGVGQVSRGILYPLHEKEALEAIVLQAAVADRDLEDIVIPVAPLDVLAQLLLSLCCTRDWTADGLYAFVRRVGSYHPLQRRHFDLVLAMLCGNYADQRLRELEARLYLDPLTGRLSAREGVPPLLYMNGGTIPDRGYFSLRLQDGATTLGELDEEFVWERKVGDSFALGGRAWQITGIDHNQVQVAPAGKAGGMTPFWKADRRARAFAFCQRIGLYLESLLPLAAAPALPDPALPDLLRRQLKVTGALWPHRHHLVFESCPSADGAISADGAGLFQYLLHTLWGLRLNQALAFAFEAAWRERYGTDTSVFANNDSLFLAVNRPITGDEFFAILSARTIEDWLRTGLEASAFFGSRFRENAGRALLLPRRGFGVRQPLWLTRLRSRRLWEAVKPMADFPILLETWRGCLQDDFDLPALRAMLAEVSAGLVKISTVTTKAVSPFGADMVWQQTNRYMYEDDSPTRPDGASYSGNPVEDVLRHSELRPLIPRELAIHLEARLQGTAAGYAPDSAAEFVQLVRDRVVITQEELDRLLDSPDFRAPGGAAPLAGWGHELKGRLCFLKVCDKLFLTCADRAADLLNIAGEGGRLLKADILPGADVPASLRILPGQPYHPGASRTPVSLDSAPDPDELFLQWLGFYGPLSLPDLRQHGLWSSRLLPANLADLLAGGRVIADRLLEGSAVDELCDSENLERLLRLRRSRSRQTDRSWSSGELVYLRAWLQGLVQPVGLEEAAGLLEAFPAPVTAWEEWLLPTRVRPYAGHQLDAAIAGDRLRWLGVADKTITLLLPENRALLGPLPAAAKTSLAGSASSASSASSAGTTSPASPAGQAGRDDEALLRLFPSSRAKYDYFELKNRLESGGQDATAFLWRQAWRGQVGADSFELLRQGCRHGFGKSVPARTSAAVAPKPETQPLSAAAPPRLRRRGIEAWRNSRPLQGYWFRWPDDQAETAAPTIGTPPPQPNGPGGQPGTDLAGTASLSALSNLAGLESSKERARLLLDRYGFLCPGLSDRELPAFQWRNIRKVLSLMELSGEILSGWFVRGLPGPQYITPAALAWLRQLPDPVADGAPSAVSPPAKRGAIYWYNACDPASLVGLGWTPDWPEGSSLSRLPSTWLVHCGDSLVLLLRKNGRAVDIRWPPDQPSLAGALEIFAWLAGRQWQPVSPLRIETINSQSARLSPYRPQLLECGFRQGNRALELWRDDWRPARLAASFS